MYEFHISLHRHMDQQPTDAIDQTSQSFADNIQMSPVHTARTQDESPVHVAQIRNESPAYITHTQDNVTEDAEYASAQTLEYQNIDTNVVEYDMQAARTIAPTPPSPSRIVNIQTTRATTPTQTTRATTPTHAPTLATHIPASAILTTQTISTAQAMYTTPTTQTIRTPQIMRTAAPTLVDIMKMQQPQNTQTSQTMRTTQTMSAPQIARATSTIPAAQTMTTTRDRDVDTLSAERWLDADVMTAISGNVATPIKDMVGALHNLKVSNSSATKGYNSKFYTLYVGDPQNEKQSFADEKCDARPGRYVVEGIVNIATDRSQLKGADNMQQTSYYDLNVAINRSSVLWSDDVFDAMHTAHDRIATSLSLNNLQQRYVLYKDRDGTIRMSLRVFERIISNKATGAKQGVEVKLMTKSNSGEPHIETMSTADQRYRRYSGIAMLSFVPNAMSVTAYCKMVFNVREIVVRNVIVQEVAGMHVVSSAPKQFHEMLNDDDKKSWDQLQNNLMALVNAGISPSALLNSLNKSIGPQDVRHVQHTPYAISRDIAQRGTTVHVIPTNDDFVDHDPDTDDDAMFGSTTFNPYITASQRPQRTTSATNVTASPSKQIYKRFI